MIESFGIVLHLLLDFFSGENEKSVVGFDDLVSLNKVYLSPFFLTKVILSLNLVLKFIFIYINYLSMKLMNHSQPIFVSKAESAIPSPT